MEQMHHGKSRGEAFLQKLRGKCINLMHLFVATRGEFFFSLKFTKYRLAAGLCPDPLGEGAKAIPRPPNRNKGGLLLRGGERRGRQGRGKGRGTCSKLLGG